MVNALSAKRKSLVISIASVACWILSIAFLTVVGLYKFIRQQEVVKFVILFYGQLH